jgi:phage N-6-adenine-methyltransferase
VLACVRFDHLFEGDATDNNRDTVAKGRYGSGRRRDASGERERRDGGQPREAFWCERFGCLESGGRLDVEARRMSRPACGRCRKPIVRSRGNLPREACRCRPVRVKPITRVTVRLMMGKVDKRPLWQRALEAGAVTETFALSLSVPEHPPDSGQNYATPWEFIRAVEGRFGQMVVDLSASKENAKASIFITKEEDSLARDWTALQGNLWLNPPYADLSVWAQKCRGARTLGSIRRIFLLCPASVSTEWWADYVHLEALVLFVRPRLTFVGATDPYPKDLALSVFGAAPGYEPWRWDEGEKTCP